MSDHEGFTKYTDMDTSILDGMERELAAPNNQGDRAKSKIVKVVIKGIRRPARYASEEPRARKEVSEDSQDDRIPEEEKNSGNPGSEIPPHSEQFSPNGQPPSGEGEVGASPEDEDEDAAEDEAGPENFNAQNKPTSSKLSADNILPDATGNGNRRLTRKKAPAPGDPKKAQAGSKSGGKKGGNQRGKKAGTKGKRLDAEDDAAPPEKPTAEAQAAKNKGSKKRQSDDEVQVVDHIYMRDSIASLMCQGVQIWHDFVAYTGLTENDDNAAEAEKVLSRALGKRKRPEDQRAAARKEFRKKARREDRDGDSE
ncbi:hypothetical protein BU23DRAFT_550965 [Bimuria novae-zelandiae CBS 107.79]|uniref:Uncharacterized protein n=1 Tax=Bimuria novae-zelandiae CBS 107.79 TaxID=1447943 RepID=A0A6A5VIH6_9PLEO|nr:hypothetical protein BU23DRAFT_550965 [Bimuria novae-zelandiae CBS 107.79]